MKRIFTLIAIIGLVAFAASCKTNGTNDTAVLSASKDAADYAAFVKWKDANEEKVKEKKVIVYRNMPAQTAAVNSNSAGNSNTATVTKKGWSKAAKGAAIGAGAGAVAGAIINKKNRALGAVIGGVVGGGVGYGIGRAKDKKDGRY